MIKSKLIIIKDLTIIFLKDSYQDLNIFDKKNKNINMKSIYVWMSIIIFFVLLYLSQKAIKALMSYNQENLFLNVYMIFLTIIFAIQTVLVCVNIFYFSKDLEMILHFPIKPVELLVAKLITLESKLYITEIIFAIVPLTMYGILTSQTILYYLFKIPLGTINIIINIPILIFTFYRLGKTVVINSIIGSLVYSLFIDILDKLPAFTNDVFLASIYGGIFLGIGTGIVLNANATTGGTELVSSLIKTYNLNIKTSSLIMIIDSSIVLLNVLVFKEIEIGLYSAIAIILMGKVLDIIVEGTNFSKLIFIISKKNDKISKEIGSYIKRGTTGIYGKGMFEDKDRLVLMCAAGRGDVLKIKHIVQANDKEAFIIITNAREVLGKGFK